MNYLSFMLLLANAALPPQLGFMTGCWSGEIRQDGSRIEEYYSGIRGGLMLGSVKSSTADETLFFEFLRIEADGDAIWLIPQPRGKVLDLKFRLIQLEADRAVFENPEHDFPRRIEYRRLPENRLMTRVAGIADEQPVLEEYITEQRNCAEDSDAT